MGAALLLTHPAAAADVPFVERPLTLAPWQASGDVGVGFAQTTIFQDDEARGIRPSTGLATYKVGWGANMEWAIGVPYVGQLGLAVGESPDGFGQAATPLDSAASSTRFARR